ncbi:MAG: hypothetical protein ACOYON_06810 [Fimbriimonas sp.]
MKVWPLFLAALLLASSSAHAAEVRLTIRPDQILNESVLGDASLLVDETASTGDPAGGKGLRPTKPFFPGWTAWRYPVNVLIDLRARHRVSRIFVFNESGEADLEVSTGKPFQWSPKSFRLSGYREWRELAIGLDTRYLRFTLKAPHELPEIAVYGEALEPPVVVAATKPVAHPPVTFDQFLGTNAFIDDPLDVLAKPVGLVREYHNWSWDTEGPRGERRFQPSGAAGGNAWFFDDFYARLKALGVTVCPAIQGTDPQTFKTAKPNDKPVVANANAEDPASYKLHAAHLFQFAARYGQAKVIDSQLVLAAGQPRRSGLGLIQYVENWNEPDQTWNGRTARFDPYELAAMCSADYDGHQGKLGPGHGVKTADPKMRLVLGGLADANLEYLRAMKLWADHHRGGSFPADVLNFHHYSHDGNEAQGFRTTGLSPESDRFEEKMAALVAWRDANLPNAEVWVTEFGYDTHPGSPLKSPAIGAYSAEEVQAAWLVRGFFALAMARVDRATMFMFRDVKVGAPGVFATSGLVTEKGQWTPKPSYRALVTLKSQLRGMRYAGKVSTGNPNVRGIRFVGNGQTAEALWCPTSADTRVAGYQVDATRTVDLLSGVERKLAGKATLEIREMPVLVFIRA